MRDKQPNPGKHVIFLGAGASVTSGYPIAADLRLRISSYKVFLDELNKAINSFDGEGHPVQDDIRKASAEIFGSNFYKHTIAQFRSGCFGSLDEFCKLMAGVAESSAVATMKRLTYLALGVHNPETKYEDSDYYAFVQRLFSDDLKSLRADITIISFNYDVYLDYLLLKALETRTGRSPESGLRNQVTGGFAAPHDRTWLQGDAWQFRLIKLHGSVEFLDDYRSSPFEMSPHDRLKRLLYLATPHRILSERYDPPIFFPWEIHKPSKLNRGESPESPVSSLIYDAIEAARRDISVASKLSFVGLSMNPLLDDTLLRICEGTTAKQIVVTSNLETNDENISGNLPPNHPAYRACQILHQGKQPNVLDFKVVSRSPRAEELRILPDFKTFIQEEMRPV